MLQGVVQRGTGTRVKAVDKPLAGKTGTTNDSKDTWFIGFTPDLAVGVFVGFDEPQSLGRDETGASAASPIFRDFMKEALAEQPGVPFRIPPGIRLVRVNAKSGELASPDDRDVIFEAFKPGSEPGTQGEVIGGLDATVDGPATGTGGLY
jgi:penicillin-binding protein 1A